MKLIYKPFGIVIGIVAGILSKKLFEAVWGIFDDEEPPKPTTLETSWPKVLGAAVVEGVEVYPVSSLTQAISFLNEQLPLEPHELNGDYAPCAMMAFQPHHPSGGARPQRGVPTFG